jgi:hypothetical protein
MQTILLVHRLGVHLQLLYHIIVEQLLLQLVVMHLGHLLRLGDIKAMEATGVKLLQISWDLRALDRFPGRILVETSRNLTPLFPYKLKMNNKYLAKHNHNSSKCSLRSRHIHPSAPPPLDDHKVNNTNYKPRSQALKEQAGKTLYFDSMFM